MRHKVNPHTLRVGVIRDWDSRWNPEGSKEISIARLNGDNFKNLNVTSNLKVFDYNSCDVERIVKTMKKR